MPLTEEIAMPTCTVQAESFCCSDSPAPTKLEIPPQRPR